MVELNGVPADLGQIQALALTNYGHYTTMRVDEQRVRGLSLHLERLMHDCCRVFDADLDPERIRYLIRHALIDINRPVVVRVTVFDPGLELGRPGADAKPHVLVTTRPTTLTQLPALRLQSAQYCRDMPDVKHVGLFGALGLRRLAQRSGFDDVLFIDVGSTVSEAATANIGLVAGGQIVWPEAGCLPGVTMRLISQIRDGHTTAPVILGQMADVDAVFATNAAVGVRPISAIDDLRWPDTHPVLNGLHKAYTAIPAEPL